MITGAHAIVYSRDAAAARAFFREVMGFPSVDAGEGWLIFGLPPAELAAHPAEGGEGGRHELYLMCDDIHGTVADLKSKGVEFTGEPVDHGWGILVSLRIPGGGEMGLYQPRHPRPPAVRTARPRARKAAKRPEPRKPAKRRSPKRGRRTRGR
jgi:catechol 2,3-dioxygenase-like lactoylglutathione lyase family enzyme